MQVSTAYHEGFPGHHLQVGLQMAAADKTTRYHRLLVWYPGSGEGWALYCRGPDGGAWAIWRSPTI